MNILDIINEDIQLDEMAAQHVSDEVLKKVKEGDIKSAADLYLDNHVNDKVSNKADTLARKLKTASAKISKGEEADNLPKSFKANKDLLKDIPLANWDKFAKEYQNIIKERGAQKERKGKGVEKSGEIKTSGQKQSSNQKRLLSSITSTLAEARNLLKLAKQNEKILDKVEEYSSVEEIESNIKALEKFKESYNRSLEDGKPLTPPKTIEEKDRLEKIYKKIKEKASKDPKIKERLEQIKQKKLDKKRTQDKKEREEWLKQTQREDPESKRIKKDVEDEFEKKSKEDEEDVRQKMEKDLEVAGGEKAEKLRKKRKLADKHKKYLKKKKIKQEAFEQKGQMLAEAYNYQGINFWDNYLMTEHLKAFTEDCLEFGEEETIEMYSELFDEDARIIYEKVVEDENLFEAINSYRGTLLFEGYFDETQILNERMAKGVGGMATQKSNVADAFRGMGNVKNKAMTPAGGAAKSGLAGIWDTIKSFGGNLLGKLKDVAASGIDFLKPLAKNGMAFIANNPIAQVALPAVAIAGGTVGAVKLINKLRKKKGQKKLKKEEIEQIKKKASENKPKLTKAKKALKAA